MVDSERTAEPTAIPCEGWWDEVGYGRQPMLQLRLRIAEGQITGSGSDIVGPFTFVGTISEGGFVTMIKQYLGQHQVEYVGSYDGEGTMFGEWRIGSFIRDKWMISFKRPPRTSNVEIEEVRFIGSE